MRIEVGGKEKNVFDNLLVNITRLQLMGFRVSLVPLLALPHLVGRG